MDDNEKNVPKKRSNNKNCVFISSSYFNINGVPGDKCRTAGGGCVCVDTSERVVYRYNI